MLQRLQGGLHNQARALTALQGCDGGCKNVAAGKVMMLAVPADAA